MTKTPMKDLVTHEHHRDRLREKVFIEPNSLNDYEILERILFNAIPRKNTNDVAHRLIDAFGSLSATLLAPPEDLVKIEGVGKSTASYIAMLGIILERNLDKKSDFPKVFSLADITTPLVNAFKRLTEEVFIVFFLDKNNEIVSRRYFYSKSKFKVDIDLKEFTKYLNLVKPEYVVITHNHPSGSCVPSDDDDNATEKICMICALHSVGLLDHIIVSGEDYYSYYYEHRLDYIRNNVELKLK